MIRIFHTADIHLGLKFLRGYSDEVRQKLIDARLAVVTRMVQTATSDKCDLFVVAGDLFDNVRVPKTLVRQAAQALSQFEGLVVVLPGNHDYVQEASEDPIWPAFSEALGEGHLVLREPRVYDLSEFNLPVLLYAGPCGTRHSSQNSIGWVREAVAKDDRKLVRVGIAHGSLAGLSPDFNNNYFPMTHEELDQSGTDLWLLGHTHVRYPDVSSGSGERIFYPSAPEPDGFDCSHAGFAWIIELQDNGALKYRSVQTGTHRFHELPVKLGQENDLTELQNRFAEFDASADLVKLTLSGRLEGSLFEQLPEFVAKLQRMALHLEVDRSAVVRFIQQNDLDCEFTQGSFPHQLLSELARSPEDSLALQLAYELVQEARS